MTELEAAKMLSDLLVSQKETFNLLWGATATVVGVLATAIGVLFKMYIEANNKRAENEKEHLKSLQSFSEGIKDLTTTLKETNQIGHKTIDLLNNPIIPTLNNLDKHNNT